MYIPDAPKIGPKGTMPDQSSQNFSTSDAGKGKGTLSGGLLVPNDVLIVNGTIYTEADDLSGVIPGVRAITLTPNGGIYSWRVTVFGAGPSGVFNALNLKFTDQTNDTYSLMLYSSELKEHTVDYNSGSPAIAKITWDP